MSAEEWAQGEIVRNITDLTKEVRDIGNEIRALGDKFITRELFELRLETALSKTVSKKSVVGWILGFGSLAGGVGALLGVFLR